MTTRINPKSTQRANPKAEVPKKSPKAAVSAAAGLAKAVSKFKKDELSLGRGKALGEAIKKLRKPGINQLGEILHNKAAASHVKGAIQDILKQVKFGNSLPKEKSPHVGVGGQLVAPNGDPLIRVKLSEGPVLGQSQYALVDPKTNEFYIQDNAGGFAHPTSYHGPLSLPPNARFQGSSFSPADLKSFEKIANGGGIKQPFPHFPIPTPIFPNVEKLKYDQPAPRPENIASERMLKSEHPFTYYAITLKDDPTHVIIKKVLTGGFVPAQPGDGSYSAPVSVIPVR